MSNEATNDQRIPDEYAYCMKSKNRRKAGNSKNKIRKVKLNRD